MCLISIASSDAGGYRARDVLEINDLCVIMIASSDAGGYRARDAVMINDLTLGRHLGPSGCGDTYARTTCW